MNVLEVGKVRSGTLDKEMGSSRNGRNLSFDSQGLGMDRNVVFIGKVVERVAVMFMRRQQSWIVGRWSICWSRWRWIILWAVIL